MRHFSAALCLFSAIACHGARRPPLPTLALRLSASAEGGRMDTRAQLVADWPIGARRDAPPACRGDGAFEGPCDDLPIRGTPQPDDLPVPVPWEEPVVPTFALAALLFADVSVPLTAEPELPGAVDACAAGAPALPALSACWAERFAGEPPIRDVQRWAADQARATPADSLTLVQRARQRAALPTIRLRGRFTDDRERDWDEVALLKGRSASNQYVAELWLEWDLAELSFGSEELRAYREGRELAELRQAVIQQATITYFDRRRVVVEQELDPGPREDAAAVARAAERALRLQELDATLDGLTGGRWSAARGSARRRDGVGAEDSPASTPGSTR
jgi:hypothetical protein